MRHNYIFILLPQKYVITNMLPLSGRNLSDAFITHGDAVG
jgi:hypothetical protein